MADHLPVNTKFPSDTKVFDRASLPHESDSIQDRGIIVATRNHELIREWARRYSAEPATGQETASGQATLDVHDGGAAMRFNFPAAARFRPIDWDEWLDWFDRENLVFIYEPEESQASGGTFGRRAGSYYRLVPAREWAGDLT